MSVRVRAITGATAALAAAFVHAGPASAHATVQINSPIANQQLPAAASTVTAQVTLGEHPPTGTTTADHVDMTIASVGSSRSPVTASTALGGGGGVAFPVNLPYNGKYQLTVKVPWRHSCPPLLCNPPSDTATDSLPFVVAAVPARPTDVKTAMDATARTVAVTWKANTEPDLLFYVVQRAKGTSTDFTVVGKATEAAFVDSTTSGAGGDYSYQVVAVRSTGLGDNNGISSDPSAVSAESTAKVPDPPPPSTAAPATTAAAAGTAPGTSAATASTRPASPLPANSPGALTTSGTVDLSGFTTVRSQARSVTPRTVPPPDPGFQSTLPFARTGTTGAIDGSQAENGAVGELAADGPQRRELGQGGSGDDRIRTMAFFAGGLLATVLLMHLLWVRSEVNRVPLEALDPEGPGSAAGVGDAGRASARRSRKRPGAGGDDPGSQADPRLEDMAAADFAPVVVAANGNGQRARPAGRRRQKVPTGA